VVGKVVRAVKEGKVKVCKVSKNFSAERVDKVGKYLEGVVKVGKVSLISYCPDRRSLFASTKSFPLP